MRHLSSVGRPALSVLLVGLAGHVGSELGFALKFPPHQISPFWPTNAILFAVLVMTPVRHWWAYTLAAFASPLWSDARAGFPLSAALFVLADLIEVFIAAVGVRRLAGGPRAFARLGNLVVYIVVAAVLAPATSAFVGALAGTPGGYWF
jgi:integral membrane sensor domain MASE1